MGRRVAYDPGRGRLWVICSTCKRWSLTPMEDRWEALEELEKLTTDKARLLSQTDNIALLRVGPLEVVRVGKAQLTEEAWWRYGRELASRRQNYKKLSLAGTAGAVVLGFLGMDPMTSIAASIATVGNVGPAFGDVGATDNYGWMSDPALVVLSFFMLVGRLEIYTVLLLFHPETWKARRSFH